AEFARILAQRLDQGVTKFEIRLDPPSLGRIDASISVNDKGAQELSIRFDNQAAFEQFSRDENAIRLALSDFGFELGDGKMKFVPPEDIKSPDGDPNVTSTAPTQAPFLAPLRPHDIVGVLDIHA
ncbi:MAG: flagellar hook-length control protein FliK, partial [Pseudomonadota bacterium]